MPSELRLGPVSYLVLGIVALRGPSTPCDLKRFVQRSIGHFWPFPHTQLYSEPARLAEAGLLDEEREETGRRRRHYSLTEAGRLRLIDWLAQPVTSPTEYRNLGLLKLFFSELVTTEQVVDLAKAQEAWHRQQLDLYQGIVDRFGDRPELSRRVATARSGVAYARALADFWADIAANPPEVDPST
jgi:DNA-binding PadR family transcriptional regulator